MSRCSICDYSQSAPSFYNEGLQYYQNNNRVVYVKEHGDICVSCLDSINNINVFATAMKQDNTGLGVYDIVDIEPLDEEFQPDMFPVQVPDDDIQQ